MKKYYKVVRNKNLASYAVNCNFRLHYSLKKFVRGKYNSKLFVFSDLKTAKLLASDWASVYECYAKNVTKPAEIGYDLSSLKDTKKYWALYRKLKKHKKGVKSMYDKLTASKLDVWRKNWPLGTLWADSVKLIKKVQ